MNEDSESNLLQFENRILYEFILSSHRAGICTIAIDRDEEIIGIVINRIFRCQNKSLPVSNPKNPTESSDENQIPPNTFVDQIKSQLYNSVSAVQASSSNMIESFSQIDWRKESISSIVSVFDKVSDQSNIIQRLQRYQNYITGCHNKYIIASTSLTIELILVDPDYRKQGIGNLLVDDLIEFCKLNSIPSIYMFTNSNYFSKLNFKDINSTDELHLLSNCSL